MQPNEMAVYLRRGLGRAVLFLQSQTGGAEAYRKVILHACLYDVRYDRQCEDHRAPYLREVAKATGEPDWYASRVCEALIQAPTDDATDETQRCELAGLWAHKGNQTARAALYAAFERSIATGEPVGASAILALDGAMGFQTVLEAYQSITSPENEPFDWLYMYELIETLGDEAAARAATTQIAQDAPHLASAIRALWDEWEAIRRKWDERKAEPKPPAPIWDEVQNALGEVARLEDKKPYRPFRRWGRVASDAILQQAAEAIAACASGERLRGLLLLFESRPFPLDPALVLPHTLSDNPRVSYPAVLALEHTTHPGIRTHGLQFIHSGRISEGVKLLTNNPAASDAALFMQALQTPMTEVELHHVSISLREYYEANPSPELFPALLLIYENGPCSMCRASTVKLLLDAEVLPDALRAECRYDTDEGTRELVGA